MSGLDIITFSDDIFSIEKNLKLKKFHDSRLDVSTNTPYHHINAKIHHICQWAFERMKMKSVNGKLYKQSFQFIYIIHISRVNVGFCMQIMELKWLFVLTHTHSEMSYFHESNSTVVRRAMEKYQDSWDNDSKNNGDTPLVWYDRLQGARRTITYSTDVKNVTSDMNFSRFQYPRHLSYTQCNTSSKMN